MVSEKIVKKYQILAQEFRPNFELAFPLILDKFALQFCRKIVKFFIYPYEDVGKKWYRRYITTNLRSSLNFSKALHFYATTKVKDKSELNENFFFRFSDLRFFLENLEIPLGSEKKRVKLSS